MRPFRNIVFLCLNTIDEVVQIFPPTGFREISLSLQQNFYIGTIYCNWINDIYTNQYYIEYGKNFNQYINVKWLLREPYEFGVE